METKKCGLVVIIRKPGLLLKQKPPCRLICCKGNLISSGVRNAGLSKCRGTRSGRSLNMGHCPICHVEVDCEADKCCPVCHEKRVKEIQERCSVPAGNEPPPADPKAKYEKREIPIRQGHKGRVWWQNMKGHWE